jgi:uncharacterized membrane protein YeaQ/YmgE (transglycosylase-associated protein family)
VILALFVAVLVLFVVLPLVGLALWTLVSTAIVGLFFGALARLVVPGTQPIGTVATILCGLIGSILGGFIGHEVGVGHLATVLLEVGVAAVAVSAYSSPWARRRGLPGPRRQIR